MFDFNRKDMICSQCGCAEYRLFVNENGQGIRCVECLHEKIIVTPQTKSHKTRFKVRMVDAWNKAKNSKSKEF